MTSPVVTFREIVYTGGVYGPIVSFAILCATGFDEAFVETEVVSNAVTPGTLLVVVIRKVVHDVLVDVAENQLLFRRVQYSQRYESYVRMRGFLTWIAA